MELMLIVWAVSVLSSIKAFVESYTLLCVLAVVLVYLLSKLKIKPIAAKIVRSGVLPVVKVSDTIEVKPNSSIKTITSDPQEVPPGQYTIYQVYDSSNRVFIENYLSGSKYLLHLSDVKEQLLADMRMQTTDTKTTELGAYAKPIKLSGWIAGLLIGLNVLLPSDTTMKYMAGAYLVQQAYDSDIVQTAAPIAKQAVINQLKTWAVDNPDINQLVQQAKELQHGSLK